MYSAGRADFEGGNQYSGTIIGDITNVVTAGTNSAGGINDFNGGAGNNVSKFNKSQIGPQMKQRMMLIHHNKEQN